MKIKEKIYVTTKKFLVEEMLSQINKSINEIYIFEKENTKLYEYNQEAIRESIKKIKNASEIFDKRSKDLLNLAKDYEFLVSEECKKMNYDDFIEHEFNYCNYMLILNLKSN